MLSSKKLSLVQIVVCAIAAVLTFLLVLTPILNLSLQKNQGLAPFFQKVISAAAQNELSEAKTVAEKTLVTDKYTKISQDLLNITHDENGKITDNVDIYHSMSAFELINSMPDTIELFRYIKASIDITVTKREIAEITVDMLKNYFTQSEAQNERYLKQIENLTKKIEDKEFVIAEIDPSIVNDESIANLRVIITPFVADDGTIFVASATCDVIFLFAGTFFKLVFLAIALIFVPIVVLIRLLMLLISFAINVKKLPKAYKKTIHNYKAILIEVSSIIAIAVILGAGFTTSGILAISISVLAVITGIVLNNLKPHTASERKYLITVTACSGAVLAFSTLLVFALKKADLFNYFSGMDGVILSTKMNIAPSSQEYAVPAILLNLLALVMSFIYIGALKGIMSRFSLAACMEDDKHDKDDILGTSIAILVHLAATIIIMSVYKFTLPEEQNIALVLGLVGGALLLAEEITFWVLISRNKNSDETNFDAVLSGGSLLDLESATTPAENVSEI